MMVMVLGGSASGKSEYAESLALQLAGSGAHYYVATMEAYGESGAYRIQRHRALRSGKGFETLEVPRNIIDVMNFIENGMQKESTLLIEDLSNLLANEMFSDEGDASRIQKQILEIQKKVQNIVIVSNNIFDDGCDYDESTIRYIRFLGELNQQIGAYCDNIIEVVAGIPIGLKKESYEKID